MRGPSDWVLITQIHPHILKRTDIPERELHDALPDEAFERGALKTRFLVPEPGPAASLADIDWAAWQHGQGELVEQQLRPLLDRQPDHAVAYFGATFIPLALDLGFRMGTFRRVHVFQHHHRDFHWKWPASSQSVVLKITGVPSDDLKIDGDAVVRVSTSYAVSDVSVEALVSRKIVDVNIGIERPDIDALEAPQDLDAIVNAFRSAIEAILRHRPGVSRIHLFVSGPVGLAFRLGAAIPTSVPPIQTYQYDAELKRHRPALVLPPPPFSPRTPVAPPRSSGRPTLLLLSAHPSTTSHLKVHREHDDIIRRIAPTRIQMDARLAVRVNQIQELLDELRPTFLHFAGHADTAGSLMLEQDDGTSAPASVAAVQNLLRLLSQDGDPLALLVLNACHSERLAEAVTQGGGARFAVGMHGAISDDAAIRFADAFYRRLDKGADLQSAFEWGCNAIQFGPLTEREAGTPRLFAAPDANTRTVLVPR